jgi:two-component system osmolarity sensor histidine kinase EnvZ
MLARTALVIILALIVTQIASALLFRHYFNLPRANIAAIGFISHLKSISAALETIPHERHREFIGRLQEKDGIRLLPANETDPANAAPDVPALRPVRQQLKLQFGEQADVYLRADTPHALWVKLPVGDLAYWVVFPRNRVERDTSLAWAGWAVFGTLVALAGAYILVRRLNQPLRALSLAAGEIGQGKTPPPLDESGAEEISAVARAFNKMNDDLMRQERERATFLAGVSHDLRTPLARLRLGIEMLGDRNDPASHDNMVEDIQDMDDIVGQFLDFAREESVEQPMPADLNRIVRDTCARFGRHGGKISLELANLPQLHLRPISMQRLLSNLIGNALKHGSDNIIVRTALDGRNIVLSVLDQGLGIPEADTERLKQPFTRLDSARSGRSGAGLGLAIVERITRLHQGRFDLLPVMGGGLEARVILPLT